MCRFGARILVVFHEIHMIEAGLGIKGLRNPDFLQIISKGEKGSYKVLKYSTAISCI